jgi:hypothetical protein
VIGNQFLFIVPPWHRIVLSVEDQLLNRAPAGATVSKLKKNGADALHAPSPAFGHELALNADRLHLDFAQLSTCLVDPTHQAFINAVYRPSQFSMSADKETTPLHTLAPCVLATEEHVTQAVVWIVRR